MDDASGADALCRGRNLALTEVARTGQCMMETPVTKVPDTGHRGCVIPCSRDCICVSKI